MGHIAPVLPPHALADNDLCLAQHVFGLAMGRRPAEGFQQRLGTFFQRYKSSLPDMDIVFHPLHMGEDVLKRLAEGCRIAMFQTRAECCHKLPAQAGHILRAQALRLSQHGLGHCALDLAGRRRLFVRRARRRGEHCQPAAALYRCDTRTIGG